MKHKKKKRGMSLGKKILLGLCAFFGITFTIFILNLDMKGAAFAYTWLNKYHDKKDLTRDISF